MQTAVETNESHTHAEDKRGEIIVPRRVSQLDFVRGLAILLVMQYHFVTVPVENSVARAIEFSGHRIGWMGVDLFFVLSGFLVGGLLVQELLKSGEIRIRRFLFRRAFKIWPGYYFYILVEICARKHPLASFAWQNILNVENYTGTALKQTWSLAVEEHFYLLAPVVLVWIYKSNKLRPLLPHILGLICMLVLCGRIWIVYGLNYPDPQWKTHARIDSLLFGVILSYILNEERKAFETLLEYRFTLTLIFMAGLIFGLYEGRGTRLMWSIGYTFNYISLAALLLLIYGYHGPLIKIWLYRTIAQIGIYSYGIYLWHLSVRQPIAKLALHLPRPIQWGSLWIGQYVAAILLGMLLTKVIEFPMLRLRDRLFPRGVALPPPERA